MNITLNTHRYTRTTLLATPDDDTDIEVDLAFNTDFKPMIEVIGDKMVIAYLVHDDDCPNPLTDCDGSGKLITDSEGVITDGNPWGHLGLEEAPYREEISRDLDADRIYDLALELITPRLLDNEDFLKFCIEAYENDTPFDNKRDFLLECINEIDWGQYGERLPAWLETWWEGAQEKAWDELYAQGKIGTYLAVPVRYCDSVHGPGTTRIQVTSLDDANAVWVPSQYEIDNIKAQAWPAGVKIEWQGACGSTTNPLHAVVTYNGEVVFDTWKWGDAQAFVDKTYGTPKHQDLVTAAEKYAQGCLDEYEKWCNGDCYGCVVETFQRDGDGNWGQTQEDACWGFIGYDYAQETLKNEFFDPTVAGMKEGPLQ